MCTERTAGRRVPHAMAAVFYLVVLAASPMRVGAEEASADTLGQRIDALRAERKYGDAAAEARRRLELWSADPDREAHEIRNAELMVAELERAAGLSDDEQRELAVADSLERLNDELWGKMWSEGDAPGLRANLDREIEIYRRLLGERSIYLRSALLFLGAYLMETEEYGAAAAPLEEALEISRATVGESRPGHASVLYWLARLRWHVGDFRAAEELHREALAVRRHFPADQGLLDSLQDLGLILWYVGAYAEAESYYREYLTVALELHGRDSRDAASALQQIGGIRRTLGDYAAARELQEEALEIRRRLSGDESLGVAYSLASLARLASAEGNPAKAAAMHRQALAIMSTCFEETDPILLQNRLQLAGALYDNDEVEEAEAICRDVLAKERKLYPDGHQEVADAMEHLAGVLCVKREGLEEAEGLYREATEICRRLSGDRDPVLVHELRAQAAIERYWRNDARAESLLVEACGIYDYTLSRVEPGLSRGTVWLRSPYDDLAVTRARLGRHDLAWEAIERARGRVLAERLLGAGRRALSSAEAAREDSLRIRLSRLEEKTAACRRVAAADTSRAAARFLSEAKTELEIARGEWAMLQRELAATHPVTEGEPLPLEHVQAALPEGAAIVGWVDAIGEEWRYEHWGYVVRQDREPAWVLLAHEPREWGVPPARQAPPPLRESLRDPSSPLVGIRRDAHSLWRERFAPLEVHLEGVDHIVAIPSGTVAGLPVESLVDAGGSCLADRFTVTYAPSSTVYAWLAESGTAREAGARTWALLVGDPPFADAHLEAMAREDVSERVALASADAPIEEQLMRSALAGNAEALGSLPRLPGTRAEVSRLADLVDEARVLVGGQASEQRLIELAEDGDLRRFDVIHLATHALVDDERPGRSALVLSQVGLPDALESSMAGGRVFDGTLRADEILREWEIDADLVTLSACETGLGREVRGEGFVGLAHTFLQAGARSVVVSLWKVDDTATSLLMQRFYENRFGKHGDERGGDRRDPMTKADALREAKQWLRGYTDEHGNRPYEHPYYWSAFILIGDPY